MLNTYCTGCDAKNKRQHIKSIIFFCKDTNIYIKRHRKDNEIIRELQCSKTKI